MPTLSTVLLFVSAFAIKIRLLYGYGNKNRPFYGCGNEKVPSLVVRKQIEDFYILQSDERTST